MLEVAEAQAALLEVLVVAVGAARELLRVERQRQERLIWVEVVAVHTALVAVAQEKAALVS